MRLLIVLVLVSVAFCTSEKRQTDLGTEYGNQGTCIADQHAVQGFLTAFNAFTIDLYKIAAQHGNKFFLLSPQVTWISLAAIAEGADHNTQKELFQLLNLPQNACTRQKFYQILTSRTSPNPYVNIVNNRTLVIDQNARVNPNWYSLVQQHSLLRIISAPVKEDPEATFKMINQCLTLKDQELNFNGNSLLLNSIDYTGLWTTAFTDAVIEKAPFHSQAGYRIGSVDLMRIKRRVRIGYVPSLNAKILELPIGIHGEYRMLFAISDNHIPNVELALAKLHNRTIFEVVESLQDSYLPIDIAIPRFVITSEINMKVLLENLGIVNLWKDPGATRFISTPPAYPTSYIQRATLTMDSQGIYPPTNDYHSARQLTDEKQYWGSFVADRPFMFGVFDAETYTCLVAGLFTKPIYPY